MDARDLLHKKAMQERKFREKEFLAPYAQDSKYAIVKMGKVNYNFRIEGFSGCGIGIFQPSDPLNAKFVKEADWEESRAYMRLLPKLHIILAYETDKGWVGYPMDADSAQHQFDCIVLQEVLIKNVSDAERFDVITACFDGMQFWYDDVFDGADMLKSQAMREAFDPALSETEMKQSFAQIKGRTPEDIHVFEMAIASWNHLKRTSTEDQIQELLKSGGGKLDKYVVRGVNIEIQWKSDSGRDYNSVVNKNTMDVVCAGICLDGEDKKFHLKDLPFLISRGERDDLIYRTRGRNMDMYGDIDD